eukprot:TRINITY_DN2810_c0_g1_i1.p1 TRINITY_DN2810_c0_g1~~TRINITY_DN2810_c0_g1_i1.p1  ORF type:complete len:453 (-),score=160.70 TRINITY_DN2810_c0_g1_i1:413-1615(-)
MKDDVTAVAASLTAPFDSAEGVWLHVYDKGLVIDSVVGTCLVLLPMFDLNLRPFEGWLPFVDPKEGNVVGRVALQMSADHTRRLTVSVLRGVCDPEEGDRIGGAAEPYVVIKVRDQRFVTESRLDALTPSWEQAFEFPVGFRDKIIFQVQDRRATGEQPGGSEVLGIDLLSRVGQYLWIPIVTAGGTHTGKILVQLTELQVPERYPIRLLQTQGLDARRMKDGKPVDVCVKLIMGKQKLKSTSKSNPTDPIWDEAFTLEVFPYESLHLKVMIDNLLVDDLLGEAYVPIQEMADHRGEQVWVDLNNTPNIVGAKVLLWLCPPPGSVYPDTLTGRKLVLLPPAPPDGPLGTPKPPPPAQPESARQPPPPTRVPSGRTGPVPTVVEAPMYAPSGAVHDDNDDD